jgi:hypothetical protein
MVLNISPIMLKNNFGMIQDRKERWLKENISSFVDIELSRCLVLIEGKQCSEDEGTPRRRFELTFTSKKFDFISVDQVFFDFRCSCREYTLIV